MWRACRERLREMNGSQDVRIITNEEGTGNQPGRGGQVAKRGFARGGKTGGRGGNKNCNCFTVA